MASIDIDELIRILPQLICENDAIKGAVISALEGVIATKEDIMHESMKTKLKVPLI